MNIDWYRTYYILHKRITIELNWIQSDSHFTKLVHIKFAFKIIHVISFSSIIYIHMLGFWLKKHLHYDLRQQENKVI